MERSCFPLESGPERATDGAEEQSAENDDAEAHDHADNATAGIRNDVDVLQKGSRAAVGRQAHLGVCWYHCLSLRRRIV